MEKKSEFQTGMAGTMCEASAALFDLRDVLIELSLALKDWQFETDLEQRHLAEDTARQLLEKIGSARGLSS